MRKNIHTLLFTALLLLPTGLQAATIDALDTIAGLATEVVIRDLTPQTQSTITVSSPLGDDWSHVLNVGENGIAHTWVAGNDLKVAGTYDIAVDGVSMGNLLVHPDSIDLLASFIDAPKDTLAVGEEMTVTVVVTDRFGNALSNRSVELISSRADDLVQALSRETDLYGQQQFIVRAIEPGNITFRAIDLISGQALHSTFHVAAGDTNGAVGGPEQFFRGNPYAANVLQAQAVRPSATQNAQSIEPPRFDHIEIDVIGRAKRLDIDTDGSPIDIIDMEQHKAESVVLQAVDQFGNPFYEFIGDAYLATTDPEAILPSFGVYNFRFEDEGRKMFTLGLKFSAAGRQKMILTERDDEIPSDLSKLLGKLDVNVIPKQVSQQLDQKIIITAPRIDEKFNDTEILVEGKGPAFINVVVSGGIEDVEGETDRTGNFSIPITLDETLEEHVIIVSDKDAPNNKAEVTTLIDVTAPIISSVAFIPENPVEGSDVVIIVESEPGLAEVSMEFNGEPYTLTAAKANSGKYQLLLTAPVSGRYNAVVTAVDALGNTSQETGTLPVGMLGLPKVQNVIAEGQISAIALRWDPVINDDIDAYRIYVGTSPDEFSYTLDTDRPTAAATVAGLRPGSKYYFVVTALEGDRESEEKSDIASANVLGVTLDITPGDGSLLVEWTSLHQDIPLANFILEYTTEAAALDDPNREDEVEQKLLNGELRAYPLRDLLNGITYHLKLTPITTTGELLNDLAAQGEGTPTGGGFTAGTSDPVPSHLRSSAPPTRLGTDDPSRRPLKQMPLSDEGIPMWMFWSILCISIGMYYRHVQHQKRVPKHVALFHDIEPRYHP